MMMVKIIVIVRVHSCAGLRCGWWWVGLGLASEVVSESRVDDGDDDGDDDDALCFIW